ncbi:MAG: hypothetical protein KDA24_15690 [Deltaproteobacteria bacterium]|nr:hypothetical protein [Deltaproteobacteria bacterium]
MKTTPIVLALGSFALVACEPALVTFPGDGQGRGDLEVLGLDLPDAPGDVDAGGTISGPGAQIGLDGTVVRPDSSDLGPPALPLDEETGCAPVVSQSGWCATLKDTPGPGSGVTFVGLDDGAMCSPLEVPVGVSVVTANSLALQGTTMAWCDSVGVVHQVDLSTGVVTTTSSPSLDCAGLTSAGGGFALLPASASHNIAWYPRLSDMIGGGNGSTWPVRPTASRISADTAVVYAAEEETDLITRWTLDGGEVDSLLLDDFGVINGFDAAPGDRLVILDGQRDLAIYDRVTGALTDAMALDGQHAGLVCFPEP